MSHPQPPFKAPSQGGFAPLWGRVVRSGRLWLVAGFVGVMVALWASGVTDYLDGDALRQHHAALAGWVESHYGLAVIGFIVTYFACVTFSVPGAVWLTLAGGLLFGTLAAAVYAVIGATAGATMVFLLARYVFRDACAARAGPALKRMEAGFRRNAFHYLLFLRLIPAFPFWLVNLVPAFLGVRLSTYVIATLIGIIPGSLVYSSVGNGLGAVFAQGGQADLSMVWTPAILGPLIGVAVLALVPVAWSRWRARHRDENGGADA